MATTTELTVEDRLDITELLARYARAIDSKDGEAYANNFTPEGVLVSNRGGRAEGRDAIRTLIDGITSSWTHRMRHMAGPPVIEGSGDRAQVRSYTTVLQEDADGRVAISSVVEYLDTCVKLDGRWLIEERINNRVLDGHLPI